MIITIKNRQGKKLSCEFSGVGENRPAVFIVHGFKGDSSQRHIRAISESLLSAGFITVRPDLTKNPGKSYLNFEDMTYKQELSDVEDILGYMRKRPEVDAKRIGIAGHSLGGMITAETAANHPEIKSLATLSAVYDFKFIAKRIFMKPFERVIEDFKAKGWSSVWSKTLKKELHIKKEFYQDAILRSARGFAPKIQCPTQVIWGSDDEAVSQSHADKYLKTIGSKIKKMEIIGGADHNYSGESLDNVCDLVVDWFKKTL